MKIILTKIPVNLITELCEPFKAYGVINETAIRDMKIYNEYLERTFSAPGCHYNAYALASDFNLSVAQLKRIIRKYKALFPARIVKDNSLTVKYKLDNAA